MDRARVAIEERFFRSSARPPCEVEELLCSICAMALRPPSPDALAHDAHPLLPAARAPPAARPGCLRRPSPSCCRPHKPAQTGRGGSGMSAMRADGGGDGGTAGRRGPRGGVCGGKGRRGRTRGGRREV
jgi:hypothetical protein